MTLAEAETVRDGTYLISKHTTPPYKPFRVTRAWMNERKTFARFRIHSHGDMWFDYSTCEFPPKGKHWSALRMEWVADEPNGSTPMTKRPAP
jgi:hypothetical protein